MTTEQLRPGAIVTGPLLPEPIEIIAVTSLGDASRFRLGLSYVNDPFFSLPIARIDPLPHQLEVWLAALTTQAEAHLDDLNNRMENRRRE